MILIGNVKDLLNDNKKVIPEDEKKCKNEFGKKITAIIALFVCLNLEALLVVSIILMWRVGDLSPLSEIVIGVFGCLSVVLTAVVSFYQWKTKAINTIKMKQELGMRIKDTDITGNENMFNNFYNTNDFGMDYTNMNIGGDFSSGGEVG